MRRYILDACALIAVLADEPGVELIEPLFHSADVEIVMNKLNLLEVYYNIYRSSGAKAADGVLDEIGRSQIQVLSEMTDAVFKEAGRLKAAYRISLADAVALAEASVTGGSLVTSDHHEFDPIQATENISFFWVR